MEQDILTGRTTNRWTFIGQTTTNVVLSFATGIAFSTPFVVTRQPKQRCGGGPALRVLSIGETDLDSADTVFGAIKQARRTYSGPSAAAGMTAGAYLASLRQGRRVSDARLRLDNRRRSRESSRRADAVSIRIAGPGLRQPEASGS